MMVLHARFAVLACLCAALPLAFPPPAEAAHLYGSSPMERHASAPYSQQRTRAHGNSFLGEPTTAHRHDSKNNEHQTPDHRASELPPLLQRYRAHGHGKAYNQRGQDLHGHVHHEVPRSAFARSRYRRGPAHPSRRSSVYVPGEHGDTYVVSQTSSRNWGRGDTGTVSQSSRAYNRRQVDESNVAVGRIDIMGTTQSPGSTLRLASLTVDPTPIDWTLGQSSAKVFPLNASTVNQTQFIMVPTDASSNATGSSKHVTLATEVFDASTAEMVMYCATYNPDPEATSPLLMTPCTGTTRSAALTDDAADPCSDSGNNAFASNPNGSQIFSYDPSSGQIEPISAASSSGTGESADDLAQCAGARVRRDTGSSTTSGSVRPSSTSTSTTPTATASQQARNVTLVYVAGALEVPAPSPGSSNATSTTNATRASIGQAAVLTTTVTTTVVAAATATGTSTRTVTPAQAAVSVSASSISSQTTTVAAPSAVTTATAARSSLSSVPTTATSRAPVNADESLEVEIVGLAASTTASSLTTTLTSSYSSSSVSTSLDAQAVASSIARVMVSRRAPLFASASISR